MNVYRYVFNATCPNDGATITYGLEIRRVQRIMVEEIIEACSRHTKGFQEDIAADLHEIFGGQVSLRAQHQGVEVLTVLGDAKPLQELDRPLAMEGAGMHAIRRL